jgi:hypothetical protein
MKARITLGVLAATFLLASGLRPAVASAAPMMPLEVGNRWEYGSVSGGHQVETITDTLAVLGRTVFVRHYAESPDAGLENWWLTGPGGEILLAGFDRHDGNSFAYDPPIVMCGGAPTLGDLWPSHVVVYEMPGMTVFQELDITMSALDDVMLSVPAGTFHSFGIGQVALASGKTLLADRGLSLDGRRAGAGPKTTASIVTDWYSADIGLVQYFYLELYQLVSFTGPTPTLATSWGRLKALYR